MSEYVMRKRRVTGVALETARATARSGMADKHGVLVTRIDVAFEDVPAGIVTERIPIRSTRVLRDEIIVNAACRPIGVAIDDSSPNCLPPINFYDEAVVPPRRAVEDVDAHVEIAKVVDIGPAARDRIVESFDEPITVVDLEGRPVGGLIAVGVFHENVRATVRMPRALVESGQVIVPEFTKDWQLVRATLTPPPPKVPLHYGWIGAEAEPHAPDRMPTCPPRESFVRHGEPSGQFMRIADTPPAAPKPCDHAAAVRGLDNDGQSWDFCRCGQGRAVFGAAQHGGWIDISDYLPLSRAAVAAFAIQDACTHDDWAAHSIANDPPKPQPRRVYFGREVYEFEPIEPSAPPKRVPTAKEMRTPGDRIRPETEGHVVYVDVRRVTVQPQPGKPKREPMWWAR